MAKNRKMANTELIECPEIEQLQPCVLFGKGLCPSCYALPTYTMRVARSRHKHHRTEKHGLIRLGTYIEVLPEMWNSFKKGEGKWSCCGERRGQWVTKTGQFVDLGGC